MSFSKHVRNKVNESPVGSVGRTSSKDAEGHLTANPELIARFRKIVRELGGKTVAMLLLNKMSIPAGDMTVSESEIESLEEMLDEAVGKVDPVFETQRLLRISGIRIRSTDYKKDGSAIFELTKSSDIETALDILGTAKTLSGAKIEEKNGKIVVK